MFGTVKDVVGHEGGVCSVAKDAVRTALVIIVVRTAHSVS
jgi:hypothetical protein